MTLPRRRAGRPRGAARLALTGDFPDTDHDMTEALQRADYDGDTYDWQAAPAWHGASDVGLMTEDTEPLPAPEPPQPRPAPVRHDTGPAPIGDTTARGWAHLFTVPCEYPAAPGELSIPCDQAWRDHTTGTYAALYKSAWDAGWRMDKLRHWACPAHARLSGLYQALYPVAVYTVSIPERRAAEWVLQRTRLHYDASHQRGRHAEAATR